MAAAMKLQLTITRPQALRAIRDALSAETLQPSPRVRGAVANLRVPTSSFRNSFLSFDTLAIISKALGVQTLIISEITPLSVTCYILEASTIASVSLPLPAALSLAQCGRILLHHSQDFHEGIAPSLHQRAEVKEVHEGIAPSLHQRAEAKGVHEGVGIPSHKRTGSTNNQGSMPLSHIIVIDFEAMGYAVDDSHPGARVCYPVEAGVTLLYSTTEPGTDIPMWEVGGIHWGPLATDFPAALMRSALVQSCKIHGCPPMTFKIHPESRGIDIVFPSPRQWLHQLAEIMKQLPGCILIAKDPRMENTIIQSQADAEDRETLGLVRDIADLESIDRQLFAGIFSYVSTDLFAKRMDTAQALTWVKAPCPFHAHSDPGYHCALADTIAFAAVIKTFSCLSRRRHAIASSDQDITDWWANELDGLILNWTTELMDLAPEFLTSLQVPPLTSLHDTFARFYIVPRNGYSYPSGKNTYEVMTRPKFAVTTTHQGDWKWFDPHAALIDTATRRGAHPPATLEETFTAPISVQGGDTSFGNLLTAEEAYWTSPPSTQLPRSSYKAPRFWFLVPRDGNVPRLRKVRSRMSNSAKADHNANMSRAADLRASQIQDLTSTIDIMQSARTQDIQWPLITPTRTAKLAAPPRRITPTAVRQHGARRGRPVNGLLCSWNVTSLNPTKLSLGHSIRADFLAVQEHWWRAISPECATTNDYTFIFHGVPLRDCKHLGIGFLFHNDVARHCHYVNGQPHSPRLIQIDVSCVISGKRTAVRLMSAYAPCSGKADRESFHASLRAALHQAKQAGRTPIIMGDFNTDCRDPSTIWQSTLDTADLEMLPTSNPTFKTRYIDGFAVPKTLISLLKTRPTTFTVEEKGHRAVSLNFPVSSFFKLPANTVTTHHSIASIQLMADKKRESSVAK
ncbi:hypothetical protein J8273_6114 [Carpediemonas membranifera]|uniref:Endonuclease/exonuclease/phosphatase domain-containing protein n=1 Tax=Carpediemonas membranifera TaxID=201153 RepID=A0A8J6B2A4_9EUKA|nr:hypothetical protein J8273_6114 [Carpediemonas membranifera]|eukprot:KAG9391364.1 hypothetical protein J8273_6114 [Carpediemonas membranifera]